MVPLLINATEQKILKPLVSSIKVLFIVKVVKYASLVKAPAEIGPPVKPPAFTVIAPSEPSPYMASPLNIAGVLVGIALTIPKPP
jgi:hypothetical protein